jgi:protoheme IX farnesyltransferase
VLVASAAAGAFNQYAERDLDARMGRTRARPFVSGALRHGVRWLWLIGAMVLAAVLAAAAAVNAIAALYVFLGAFFYAIVYTVWLKRRTWMNIVIGGCSGSFAVLAGSAAVTPALSAEALALAFVLFLWTPPHFWSLAAAKREDYLRAGVPMLPVVTGPEIWGPVIFSHVAALVALSFLPLLFGLGWVYGLFAAAGGLLFLRASWRLMRDPGRAAALASFRASLLQFALLALGVVLDEGVRWAV